ncbi:ATP-binding protein [Legionella clemsonensis]|uniref:histidine kinase n=1 Tax=Legionella clemsonensis TaxID=1867846 RepID=A0A222NYX5_9GAMM|nr:ATP-binding protein [Legionella clemsonensis]ASQ44800.1 Sensor histidine kinase TmoS [Legionella clemsonensis]
MRHLDSAFFEVQKNIEEMANQLCLAVKGEFDFTIKIDTNNESMQKLTMLVNFVLDTARRSLIEVREKNTRLMELDQLKSDFIANVSHELRTPLTLILAPLKTILENKNLTLPEEVLRNLQRIHRNAARLYTLVNNILDFSKLEAEKFNPHDELINLNAFISQLVDDAQDLAKERDINLSFKAYGTIKEVLLDKNMLEKILLNLISNALKFTPAQGFITIELRQNPNICILIRDSGTGIPKEQLPFIFDRFHQIDSSSTRAYEGTGIGLTVVKQFVELLQGTISVESDVGRGTTFRIDLPARFAKRSQSPKKEITAQATDSSFENFKTGFFTGPTAATTQSTQTKSHLPWLVLADDNPDIRSYIVSLLKDKFNIITVDNGKAALDEINKSNPHVILSDIMMPLLDGYELTKILKSQKETCHIPVILITAKAGDEAVVRSLDAGADDYLAKPFSPQELIARTTAAYRHYERYLENCRLNLQLLTTARRAGMADIATSILHNVGNVLNSANVSLDMIKEYSSHSHLQDLTRVSLMLKDHTNNLASYLTTDDKGKLLPDYLLALIKKIDQEQETIAHEMSCLRNQLDHIKDVVAMQKSLSGISGILEKFSAQEIINSAISMCNISLKKRGIKIKQEMKEDIFIITDKAKLLQILINLIQNAIDALNTFDDVPRINKLIHFTVKEHPEADNVSISVRDNGIGIAQEHKDKIFTFGFTTKSQGHGFGLHTSALAAKELGGDLQVKSEGIGYGAEFILTLPLKQVERRAMHGDDSYKKLKNSHY